MNDVLMQKMMRVVEGLLDGQATPEARLEFGRLLAEAGLVEEAAAAAGAAADGFEAAGDTVGGAGASLVMAEHLVHLGYHDIAAARLERVLQLIRDVDDPSAEAMRTTVHHLFTRLDIEE